MPQKECIAWCDTFFLLPGNVIQRTMLCENRGFKQAIRVSLLTTIDQQ